MASKSRPSPALRKKVAERAKGFCEYCQSPDSFASEHIYPRSMDGATKLANLAWACGGCNLFKSNKTEAYDPDSGEIVELFNPRIDDWTDHFFWSDDFQLIHAKTAKGRATISALRMNRSSVVNLRHALIAIGRHPPEVEER